MKTNTELKRSIRLTMFFVSVCILIISGCSETKETVTKTAADTYWDNSNYIKVSKSTPEVLILNDSGNIELLTDNNQHLSKKSIWAERPVFSGIAISDNIAFAGINKKGAFLIREKDDGLQFKFIPGNEEFTKKTIGSVFFFQDRFYCHIFRSTIFSENTSESKGYSLASFGIGDNELKMEKLPIDNDYNSLWEVSAIIPRNNHPWFAELKKIYKDETFFDYVSFEMGKPGYSKIDKAVFESAIKPQSMPDTLKLLSQSASSMLSTNQEPFIIRAQKYLEPSPLFYQGGKIFTDSSEEENIQEMFAFFTDSETTLASGKYVYTKNNNGSESKLQLIAPINDSFVLRDTVKFGKYGLACWEDFNFPETLDAGLFIFYANPEESIAKTGTIYTGFIK